MAATVLSGNGAVAYTNNTGQNVRVIINYFKGNHDYLNATKPFEYTIAWGNGAAAYYTASNNQFRKFLVWEKYSISGYCSGKWSRISNQ